MIGELNIDWQEFTQWLFIFILWARAMKAEKSLTTIIGFFTKLEEAVKVDKEKTNVHD